ncbi:MAG TPA: alpha/beta fold hydrolase [Rhodanobacteraceae bacterium]
MAMKTRNLVRVIVLVMVVAWFGWNFLARHHKQATPVAVTPAAAVPASATSAALEVAVSPATWKLGSVRLHACMIGGSAKGGRGASVKAWCDQFSVPENRADPSGRHIRLNMAIVRAQSPQPAKDMVVLLAGGPGEAATDAAHVAQTFPELARRHDFLLIDQRGTGHSNPLRCQMQGSPLQGKVGAAELRKQVVACLAQVRKHADPRFYTTTAAVEDLEDVRKALGSPTFDLLGISYGTRVAQEYLMRYPQGVRSVILDSPVPNQYALGERMAGHLQQALEKDFALCGNDPVCKQRFGDPMASLTLLASALKANPHEVSTRDPVTFDPRQQMLDKQTLVSVVRLFAYSRAGITLLPLTINAAAHGDVGPLLGQYTLLRGRNGELSRQLANGMNWSVICSEDADLLKPRPADADTLLGNSIIDSYQTICSVWPHGSRPTDFHAPLKSGKPVLILSGALDPVTPPSNGKLILRGLTDARQLIVTGQGHGVEAVGCMPHLIYEFVKTLTPRQLDARCLDKQGPVHPFITFNGATP